MTAPASPAPARAGLSFNWAEAHLLTLERAVWFLRARGILCSKVDRESDIARFRVTGKLNALSGHDVIELAEGMGFSA